MIEIHACHMLENKWDSSLSRTPGGSPTSTDNTSNYSPNSARLVKGNQELVLNSNTSLGYEWEKNLTACFSCDRYDSFMVSNYIFQLLLNLKEMSLELQTITLGKAEIQ